MPREVPKDTYKVEEEIDSEEVDRILNHSEFLTNDYSGNADPMKKVDERSRQVVRAAEEKINSEYRFVRRNLKLTIKLYNLEGGESNRVRYIVIQSGQGKNCIECYVNSEGNLVWERTRTCIRLKALQILQSIWPFIRDAVSKIVSLIFEDGILKVLIRVLEHLVIRLAAKIKSRYFSSKDTSEK